MRRTRKILLVILATMMVLSIVPIIASAATYGGTCGDNVTWTYDSSTYTLTISGTGDMYDYKYNNRPWESYKNKIKSVVVNDDITKIGDFAFYRLSKVESIIFPENISEFGEKVFYGCESLTNIVLPDNITLIDESTFAYCENLTSIIIPDKVTKIGESAFASQSGLQVKRFSKNLKIIGVNKAFNKNDKLFFIVSLNKFLLFKSNGSV